MLAQAPKGNETPWPTLSPLYPAYFIKNCKISSCSSGWKYAWTKSDKTMQTPISNTRTSASNLKKSSRLDHGKLCQAVLISRLPPPCAEAATRINTAYAGTTVPKYRIAIVTTTLANYISSETTDLPSHAPSNLIDQSNKYRYVIPVVSLRMAFTLAIFTSESSNSAITLRREHFLRSETIVENLNMKNTLTSR